MNFAARIEDLARDFECDILLSEESVSRLKGDYKLEQMPSRMVKGYSRSITVYMVLEDSRSS